MTKPLTGPKARNRAKLLAAMEEGPLTVVQIMHRTRLSESTIRLHIREMDAEGRIGSQPYKAPSGKGRAFFLKDSTQTAGESEGASGEDSADLDTP